MPFNFRSRIGQQAGLGASRINKKLGSSSSGSPPFVNTKSLVFGGSDEYLRITDHASLDITTNLTVSAWVKAAANSGRGIVAKHDWSAPNKSFALCQDFLSPGKMCAIVTADGNNEKYYQSSLDAFNGTDWFHIAFTFVSNTLKLYVNGVLDPSPVAITENTVNSLHVSTLDVTIASILGGGASSNLFEGNIDEPSIWNATLTDAEVAAIYNSGVPTNLLSHSKAANLVSWWRMGDAGDDSITSIKDQKGSNHATPTNMESGDIVTDAP